MKTFLNYAEYYDLLNQGKDYQKEVKYIISLLNNYAPQTKSILDLGCGTGLHDIHFAKKGYKIHGVDLSKEMISIANERVAKKSNLIDLIKFSEGDARTLNIDKSFDAVIALFHVMSYQITNDDIQNTLTTVAKHIEENGVFIFDCWYGPAVLSDKPYKRTKIFEDHNLLVKRVANPVLYPSKNIVDVNFDISIQDKNFGEIKTIKELHKMRYLFEPEIELMLLNNGFDLLTTEEWLTGNNPSYKSWYVTFICRKK